jgi:hypothetical protein
VLALAICRLAGAAYSGLEHSHGDFYATLPGAYAERLNPVLWNSQDLRLASGFGRAEYLYGPTQYLTIFPLVFLDSYQALAKSLLLPYLALILLSAHLMWRSFRLCAGDPPYGRIAVLGSTCLFLPLLQAFVQREFEVTILFAASAALYALLTHREGLAGALLGYAAWFKLFPLTFLPYFAIRRRGRAVAGFVLMSAAVLIAAEAFLDLSRFRTVIELATTQTQSSIFGEGFCEVWSVPAGRNHAIANSTRAGVKWALCSFQDRWNWFSAPLTYVAYVMLIAGASLFGYLRLARAPVLAESDERWRRSLEMGVILSTPFLLYAHYYYLIFAIVPLNALLMRYLHEIASGRRCRRLWVWLASYLTLSAFVVPPSVTSELLGIDFWRFYMRHAIYFIGEALLLALLLYEYVRIPVGTPEVAPGRQVVTRAARRLWFHRQWASFSGAAKPGVATAAPTDTIN